MGTLFSLCGKGKDSECSLPNLKKGFFKSGRKKPNQKRKVEAAKGNLLERTRKHAKPDINFP